MRQADCLQPAVTSSVLRLDVCSSSKKLIPKHTHCCFLTIRVQLSHLYKTTDKVLGFCILVLTVLSFSQY